jgi:WD40 repeat protein
VVSERDSSARLWSATTGGELARFTGHEHSLRDLAVSPDGRFLATAGEGTRIMLWDIRTRKLSKVLTGPTDFVNALAFSRTANCWRVPMRLLEF